MRCALTVTMVGILGLTACAGHDGVAPDQPARAAALAVAATAPPAEAAAKAVARSPALLGETLAAYDELVATHADATLIARAKDAVDHAAAQRDAVHSRLYWYTDLDEAKAEAVRTGKPILSLRLLGRLDEDLSCANSRLFRILLYANDATSSFLRDTYVLHWSSERPAPQVTLDFGDGRVVRRTITGNSAHYVLDAQGRVVDALPGLYGPARFERTLRESLELAKQTSALDDDEYDKRMAKYHQQKVWALTATWRKQLTRAYQDTYPQYIEQASLPVTATMEWTNPLYDSLPAKAVNELTFTKADLEQPTLSLLQPHVSVSVDAGPWEKVAQGLPAEHVDANGRALFLEKHPRDWSTRATPVLDEARVAKELPRFEHQLTMEGFRNEMALHGAVHRRLAHVTGRVELEGFNAYVYAALFKSPKEDGWLGLTPDGSFTGLPDDGIVSR